MKSSLIALCLLCCSASVALAGTIKIAVSDRAGTVHCLSNKMASNAELTVYAINSEELESLIHNFLAHRPNKLLIDAALTNAGIVFCEKAATVKFARLVLSKLDAENVSPRLIALIAQYENIQSFSDELNSFAVEHSSSRYVVENLAKLKSFRHK